MEVEDWMDEARAIAACCWTDDETKDTVMDPVLAESIARCIACWMETAAMHARNEEFWRDLVYQCADNLGPLREEAFTQDDGGKVDKPLGLKVPGLVGRLASLAGVGG